MPDKTLNALPMKIQRLEKGDKTRTAMHADVMNEIIDAINALRNITIADDLGTVTYSDANVVIKLNTTECPEA